MIPESQNFIGNVGGIILEQVESLSVDNPNDIPVIGSDRWIMCKANEIYNVLGKGYPECVYHKAFEYELRAAGLEYETEKVIPIMYKGTQVGFGRADIIIKGDEPVILEFKAIGGNIGIKELEQLGHYMTHTGIKTGVIINFSQPSLTPKNTVDFIFGRVNN